MPSAPETSKVPIAPMGDSHFARCLQGGGVYIYISMVSFSSCTITGNTATYVRAHAQKFPSPRWETHNLLLVCRAAVSMFTVAKSQSSTPKCIPTKLPVCVLIFKIPTTLWG